MKKSHITPDSSKEQNQTHNKCQELSLEANHLNFTSEAVMKIINELRSLRIKEKNDNNSSKVLTCRPQKAENQNSQETAQPTDKLMEKELNGATPTVEKERIQSIKPVEQGLIDLTDPKQESKRKTEINFVIGTQIVKTFNGIDFKGLIVKEPSLNSPFYRIRYEDGNEEEMSLKEVATHVIRESTKEAHQGDSLVEQQNQLSSSISAPPVLIKRKRGRPRENPIEPPQKSEIKNEAIDLLDPADSIDNKHLTTRKRGRPSLNRKNVTHENENSVGLSRPKRSKVGSATSTSVWEDNFSDVENSGMNMNSGNTECMNGNEDLSSANEKPSFSTPFLKRTVLKRQKMLHLHKTCVLVESHWVETSVDQLDTASESSSPHDTNEIESIIAEEILTSSVENKGRRRSTRRKTNNREDGTQLRRSSRLEILSVGSSESSFAETVESHDDNSEEYKINHMPPKRRRRQSVRNSAISQTSVNSVEKDSQKIPVKKSYTSQTTNEDLDSLHEYYNFKKSEGRSNRYKKTNTHVLSSPLY